MQLYLFFIETKPKLDSLRANYLCGAMASIWVFDKSKASAQEKAFSYINAYGWAVVKVEHSFLPTPEFIASLDEPEARTYRKFERNGISAQFDILPKQPRQGIGCCPRHNHQQTPKGQAGDCRHQIGLDSIVGTLISRLFLEA